MVELLLARHGETEENVAGILQGHLPGHLTPAGRSQAAALREALNEEPVDALVASDLLRARQTVEILSETRQLPIHFTPLLRERDWGELTGIKVSELRVRPSDFPPSVESPQALQVRARQFLSFLLERFDGQKVLAVGHGYFNRCVLAEVQGVTPREIPRVANAEVHRVRIVRPSGGGTSLSDEVSAS